MLSTRVTVLALSIFLSTGTALWAHPGHGATDSGTVTHYLVEPSHGWWILLLGALIGATVMFRQFTKTKRAQARVRK